MSFALSCSLMCLPGSEITIILFFFPFFTFLASLGLQHKLLLFAGIVWAPPRSVWVFQEMRSSLIVMWTTWKESNFEDGQTSMKPLCDLVYFYDFILLLFFKLDTIDAFFGTLLSLLMLDQNHICFFLIDNKKQALYVYRQYTQNLTIQAPNIYKVSQQNNPSYPQGRAFKKSKIERFSISIKHGTTLIVI